MSTEREQKIKELEHSRENGVPETCVNRKVVLQRKKGTNKKSKTEFVAEESLPKSHRTRLSSREG